MGEFEFRDPEFMEDDDEKGGNVNGGAKLFIALLFKPLLDPFSSTLLLPLSVDGYELPKSGKAGLLGLVAVLDTVVEMLVLLFLFDVEFGMG